MCQCVLCNFWWCNWCGVLDGGCHWALCLWSCWLCKPMHLERFDPYWCHICQCDGLGGNLCCCGEICCAPYAVREWSTLLNRGGAYDQGGPSVTQIGPPSQGGLYTSQGAPYNPGAPYMSQGGPYMSQGGPYMGQVGPYGQPLPPPSQTHIVHHY